MNDRSEMGSEYHPGNLYIVSAPSGAGKTSLMAALIDGTPDVTISISHTTRARRSNEREGKDYYFVSPKVFKQMVEERAFLEYARVFDHYYGTSRSAVIERLRQGVDVILEIDWQGAQQLTQAAADDLVKIFVLPPDMIELEKRLRTRAQDSDEVIAKRMAKSEAEISHWAEYDYVIVNEDLDTAMEALRAIITSERMKRKRQLWLGPFVRTLTQGG